MVRLCEPLPSWNRTARWKQTALPYAHGIGTVVRSSGPRHECSGDCRNVQDDGRRSDPEPVLGRMSRYRTTDRTTLLTPFASTTSETPSEPDVLGRSSIRSSNGDQIRTSNMDRIQRGVRTQVAESGRLTRPVAKAIRRRSEDPPKAKKRQWEGKAPVPRKRRAGSHRSNSEKGAPARLPAVITRVESALDSKSRRVANASFLGTEWNSWTRWTSTSIPAVRYRMQSSWHSATSASRMRA